MVEYWPHPNNERAKLNDTVIDLAKAEYKQNVLVGSKYIDESKFCVTRKHLVHVLWKKVDLFISFSKHLIFSIFLLDQTLHHYSSAMSRLHLKIDPLIFLV